MWSSRLGENVPDVHAAGESESQLLEHLAGTFVADDDVGEGQTAALGHPLGHVRHGQTGVSAASIFVQSVQPAHAVRREFH